MTLLDLFIIGLDGTNTGEARAACVVIGLVMLLYMPSKKYTLAQH